MVPFPQSLEAPSADRWPDDVRLSDIEPCLVCEASGTRGTDVPSGAFFKK
jgi:hypothetical protein